MNAIVASNYYKFIIINKWKPLIYSLNQLFF